VKQNNWSDGVLNSEASRRAGGRRRYNLLRKYLASFRKVMLLKACGNGYLGLFTGRGLQTQMAEKLGVSKATISRDVDLIYKVYERVGVDPKTCQFLNMGVEQLIQSVNEETGFEEMKKKFIRKGKSKGKDDESFDLEGEEDLESEGE